MSPAHLALKHTFQVFGKRPDAGEAAANCLPPGSCSLHHARLSIVPRLTRQENAVTRPGQVARSVGGLSCTPRGYRFNPQSGHVPRVQGQSLVGVCM